MTVVILILATLILLAAMFFLTLSVNEFEKNVKSLETLIQKRYRLQFPIKAEPGKGQAPKKPPAQAKA